MRYLYILCCVCILTSCTKEITKTLTHDIHDTAWVTRVDTFHHMVVIIDTFVKKDTHLDTVYQKVLDTVMVVKTKHDTLYQWYYDTVYLTKLTHDTVPKNIYLHDTVNNYFTIVKYDTVIKVNTITLIDTLFQYGNYVTSPYNPNADSITLLIAVGSNHSTAYFTSITFSDMTTYDPATFSYKRSVTIFLDSNGQHQRDGTRTKYPAYPMFTIDVQISDVVNGVSGAVWLYAYENDETRSKRIRYEGYTPVSGTGFSYIYPYEFLNLQFN